MTAFSLLHYLIPQLPQIYTDSSGVGALKGKSGALQSIIKGSATGTLSHIISPHTVRVHPMA